MFAGFLGADCRTRVDGDNVAITFSVGVTKQYKNRQNQPVSKTTWVGCTIWRKTTNLGTITNYLVKGKYVLVMGEPSVRTYLDNENKPKAVLDCRVSEVELGGSAPPADQGVGDQQQPAQQNDDNDDLPF